MVLKNFLKEFRAKNELNQAELAELCGLSANNISAYEAGYYAPSDASYEKLAKGLALPVTRLKKMRLGRLTPPPSLKAKVKGKKRGPRVKAKSKRYANKQPVANSTAVKVSAKTSESLFMCAFYRLPKERQSEIVSDVIREALSQK